MNEDVSRIRARAASLENAHADLMRDLVATRKRHNISQEIVAERMSVSQPTVAAFERYDSNPTLSTIRRYALAIGARIQNSVIDDCEAHASPFEQIVESLPFTVEASFPARDQWRTPKIKVSVLG